MIYILAGNDTKKRNARLGTLTLKNKPVFISSREMSLEMLASYASSNSLFGELPAIAVDNIIGQGEIAPSKELLEKLKDSQTLFIFLEDKLLVSNEKKYSKYATIEKFDEKKPTATPKFNTFAIADAFGRHDKKGAWMLYREAIEAGIDPEPIAGILFWKIKTMLLNKVQTPSVSTLKKQSSDLVSLYHRAHRGESDFVISLEQFILSSLSK